MVEITRGALAQWASEVVEKTRGPLAQSSEKLRKLEVHSPKASEVVEKTWASELLKILRVHWPDRPVKYFKILEVHWP